MSLPLRLLFPEEKTVRLVHRDKLPGVMRDSTSGLYREEAPLRAAVRYAILSHTWVREPDKEILLKDISNLDGHNQELESSNRRGFEKIMGACHVVKEKYLWVDACCIDQENQAELSTSINSMYRWYRDAAACYVYLEDYDCTDVKPDLTSCRWFRRGWTLQELVASKIVKFFDKNWEFMGDKTFLQTSLVNIARIPVDILSDPTRLGDVSVACRMSWFAGRETTKPEDKAYCLMGLFGVYMPILYGEGEEHAFRRLQEVIMSDHYDHSIFAWKNSAYSNRQLGLLAPSPDCFAQSGRYFHNLNYNNNAPYSMTNKGLCISLFLMKSGPDYIATLDCHDPKYPQSYISIFLRKRLSVKEQYYRVRGNEICGVINRGTPTTIYVKQPVDL